MKPLFSRRHLFGISLAPLFAPLAALLPKPASGKCVTINRPEAGEIKALDAPARWVRATVIGGKLTGYTSPDGKTWVEAKRLPTGNYDLGDGLTLGKHEHGGPQFIFRGKPTYTPSSLTLKAGVGDGLALPVRREGEANPAPDGTPYLYLPGVSGNYMSVPDAVGLDQDIQISSEPRMRSIFL
jgi:hypothetical protein